MSAGPASLMLRLVATNPSAGGDQQHDQSLHHPRQFTGHPGPSFHAESSGLQTGEKETRQQNAQGG